MDTPAVTLSRIITTLNWIYFNISQHNALNRTDEALMVENTLGDVLGLVLGISLKNINRSTSNAAAVDLIDDTGELVIQVTTRASGFSHKKQLTIEKFKNIDEYVNVKKVIVLFFTTEKVSADLLKEEIIREGCIYEGYSLIKLTRAIEHCNKSVHLEILKALESEFGDYDPIKLIEREEYPEVKHYIPRPLVPVLSDAFVHDDSIPLTDLFESRQPNKPIRILIKGQSAMGKSIELRNLANFFSNTELGMLPILIPLINFKGKLDDYVSVFQKKWSRVRPKQLILLFDGIDDISGALLKDFIIDFNLFVQANPKLNIVATIRTNVYTSEIGHGVSEQLKLREYYLNELSRADIDRYLGQKISEDLRGLFETYVLDKLKAEDVLLNPFYLSHLVEIFQQNLVRLPENKAEMIESFVDLKYKKDKQKYASKADIPALKNMAEKAAVYLTLRGRNSISASELFRFTELTLDDIRRCSLFKVREQGYEIFISFEHNNFQEYLSATILKSLPWEQLKPLVFHSSENAVLKPKMINTVNFLFALLPVESENFNELLALMIQHNQEILMQFEQDKIYPNRRLELFKRYVQKGMSEKIHWLNSGIKPHELAAFTEYSSKALDYTLQLIKSERDSVQMYTLSLLLCAFPIDKVRQNVMLDIQKSVCDMIIEPDLGEAVHSSLIFILSHFNRYDLEVLEVLKNSQYIGTRDIRRSILKFINDGNFSDHFEYILYSDEILSQSSRSHINVRHIYLQPLADQLNKSNALLLIEHFTANVLIINMIVGTVGIGTSATMDTIYQKIAALYNAEPNNQWYTAFSQLISAITSKGRIHKGWGSPETFFTTTGTSKRAFFDLLKNGISAMHMAWLPKIFDAGMTDELILVYAEGRLDLKTVIQFRNGLELNKYPYYSSFSAALIEACPDDFKSRNDDYKLLFDSRPKRNLDLLRNRELFLKEAEDIYAIFEQEKLNEPALLLDYLLHHSSYETNSRILSTIIFEVAASENLEEGFIHFENWLLTVDWDKFVLVTVYRHLREGQVEVPEKLLHSSINYINEAILPNINILETKLNRDFFYHPMDSDIYILTYFYQCGLIKPTKDILLDFIYLGEAQISDTDLYKQIKKDVGENAFKDRVITNLCNRKLTASILVDQALISTKYGYREAAPLLVSLLEGNDIPEDFKYEIFQSLVALNNDPNSYMALLDGIPKITFQWHAKLCEVLENEPSQVSGIIELIELSLEQHHDPKDDYWIYHMLLQGIKLGSRLLAEKMIKSLGNLQTLPGHYQLPDLDSKFASLSIKYPGWLIELCFDIMPSTVHHRDNSSFDLCVEFLEKVIRYTSVQQYELAAQSLGRYDQIISRYAPSDPNFNYLQWYKKRLLKEYYSTSKGFENEEKTWDILDRIFI